MLRIAGGIGKIYVTIRTKGTAYLRCYAGICTFAHCCNDLRRSIDTPGSVALKMSRWCGQNRKRLPSEGIYWFENNDMVSLSVESTEFIDEAGNNGVLCLFFCPDFLDMVISNFKKVVQCRAIRQDERDSGFWDSDDLYVSAIQIRLSTMRSCPKTPSVRGGELEWVGQGRRPLVVSRHKCQ